MKLSSHPVYGKAVRTVRCDLEIEHLSGDRQHLRKRPPWLEPVLLEHQDPGMLRTDRQLVLGEDHPVRFDATERGLAKHRAIGHHRAGPGHCDRLTGRNVRGSAHDLGG